MSCPRQRSGTERTMPSARLFWLLVWLLVPSTAWAGLTYCPLPVVNPEKVVAETRPMLDYLSRSLQLPIQINYPSNNAEVVKAFMEDRTDMAEIGALPYLLLREVAPHARALVFILEEGASATYTCALVAPFDGAPSLEILAAEAPLVLASTQTLSTCGPLSASWLLHTADIASPRVDFKILGNHEEVALAVARAEYPAGSMKTLIAQRYQHLGVRVLAETPPLPVFALVVNTRTVPEATIVAIKEALLNVSAEERTRWAIGRHGFQAVEADSYGSLEQFFKALGTSPREFFVP